MAAPKFESYEGLLGRGIIYARSHLWRLERLGKFPKRIKLNGQRVVWLADEIDAWQQAQINAREMEAVS
jgi:prophage regulatory protein